MSRGWTRLVAVLLLAGSALAHAAPPLAPEPLPLALEPEAYRPHILSGGPGKDGIPSIDRPQFVDAAAADRFLGPDDIVFGLIRNGEVRAYPHSILVWHEIVNDSVGGENISVTYCPLTATAIGFLRGETSLGVSGNLLNSNLVMYDRATDSAWPQVLGTAIEGELTGSSLQDVRLIWTTWERWRARYPDTEVLSIRTGHIRPYGSDPYGSYTPPGGYYISDHILFPLTHRDGRLPPKEMVTGVRTARGALSFRKSAVRAAGTLAGSVDGQHYLAAYDPELDAVHVFHNPERLQIEPGRLSFAAAGVRLDGAPMTLEPAAAFDAFWFAWAAFYPEAMLYE
jgi:hypothetical protein